MELKETTTNFVSRFESACARIDAVMGLTRPVLASEYSKLPDVEQERVLLMVEGTATCAEQMVREGLSPFDAGTLSWRVLSYMGLKPDSSAYTLYHPNDTIEVYNSSHKLIFASLNFLKLSAYPLDTLYSRPWTELWSRSSDSVLQMLWEAMSTALANPSGGTVALPNEPYVVTENLTGRQAVVRCRGFSPVAERRGDHAVLAVNEIVRVLPTA